jgi:hypothetical protein
MSYCPFFQTLHDEKQPVGRLGQGTHYSVLRVPTWQDPLMNHLEHGALLDFAIIWDDDHDERVIEVIQTLYMAGLLAPVRYIGERKGMLSVLVDPAVVQAWGAEKFDVYGKKVHRIAQSLDDPWPAEVRSADVREHSIIHSTPAHIAIYLQNIQMLWQLGVKPAS